MGRDEQIAAVEQGFKDLAEFARSSWSNIAITDKVKALQLEVEKLYAPVIVVKEVPGPPLPPPPPPAPPAEPPKQRRARFRRPAIAPRLPDDFQPIHVDENTRWG